ncbi:ABC transporter permease [Thalassobius sp. Cn5-15]|uniref:ABC transporter permease n=1 Tax=Thalassobius sp. Cn5-15 TaxID=2917763 RepID=UPI001EF2DB14|nr:ABC transporter permease subunit [Thalassobius sp. Cn5-15]MCG7492009.1 ABC transporter permease subunit [Thalassobius sp. Cn5-15]
MTTSFTLTRPAPLPRQVPRRLLAKLWHHRSGRLGLILGLALCLFAMVGAVWTPADPNQPNYINALKPPQLAHPFGTDATGRDMFSRSLDAAHRSLGAATLVLAAVFVIGLLIGTTAGLLGGVVDTVLMRTADIAMTLPGLVLAFAVLGILGPGFLNLLLALIIADWAWYARLARSLSLNARHQPHVIAARLAGVPNWRIICGHILPDVALQLGIVASLALGGMIGAISGFSFLGLGVQPPHAEWGAMLSEARLYFTVALWLLIAPAGLIFLSVLSANLIGNALRDVAGAKDEQS